MPEGGTLVNLFPTECRLLLTLANSLYQDQAWQNVASDLNPICMTNSWCFWKDLFWKSWFCKISADNKNKNKIQGATIANSLDTEKARQNMGPDLDLICLTPSWYSWKIYFKKVDFEKKKQTTKKHEKFPRGQKVKCWFQQRCPSW